MCQTTSATVSTKVAGFRMNSWWSAPMCRGRDPRVLQLAHVRSILVADRERLDRPPGQLRHDGDDEARVDAAAQVRAERHLAHQPDLHARRQWPPPSARSTPRSPAAVVSTSAKSQYRLTRVPDGDTVMRWPGHQLPHVGQRGARPDGVIEARNWSTAGAWNGPSRNPAASSALISEANAEVRARVLVVERLLAQPVPGEEQRPVAARPRWRTRTCRASTRRSPRLRPRTGGG